MAITNKFDDLEEDWMVEEHYNVINEIIKKYDENSICVEIGSWKGRSAINFLIANKKIKLFCYDIWPENIKNIFKKNLIKLNLIDRVILIKDQSKNIQKYFNANSIDFVYLDACHKKESVFWDLLNIFPLLKKNALILGDDWQKNHVKNAIDLILSDKIYKKIWTKKYTFLLKKNCEIFKILQ